MRCPFSKHATGKCLGTKCLLPRDGSVRTSGLLSFPRQVIEGNLIEKLASSGVFTPPLLPHHPHHVSPHHTSHLTHHTVSQACTLRGESALNFKQLLHAHRLQKKVGNYAMVVLQNSWLFPFSDPVLGAYITHDTSFTSHITFHIWHHTSLEIYNHMGCANTKVLPMLKFGILYWRATAILPSFLPSFLPAFTFDIIHSPQSVGET